MTTVNAALQDAITDLNAIGAQWALIGGVAGSFRAEPRFTKDVDFAVAVAGEPEADQVVYALRSRGYSPVLLLEEHQKGRLSTARLARMGSEVIVDLMFAGCGIEPEVVAGAGRITVLPGVTAPVASRGHLIAMKVLAGRNRDLTDLESLIPAASPADLDVARRALQLIRDRGFHHGQDVVGNLERYVASLGR